MPPFTLPRRILGFSEKRGIKYKISILTVSVCSDCFAIRLGGPTRVRTWDLPVMSRWLFQLSYGPSAPPITGARKGKKCVSKTATFIRFHDQKQP